MERYINIKIKKTTSTNSLAKEMEIVSAPNIPFVVSADHQTGGRGQRGNSWESEPGKNLTFSLVLFPNWMSSARQFELSMLISIGMVNALRNYVEKKDLLKIKWPNDIYYGDRKLAGILIENSLGEKSIEKSVAGIGINVNQTVFLSDAPNPVSLFDIAGKEYEREELLEKVVSNILDMFDQYEEDAEVDELAALYNNMLWRKDRQVHKWIDAEGIKFEGTIDYVDIDGRIFIREKDGEQRSFLFKELTSVL